MKKILTVKVKELLCYPDSEVLRLLENKPVTVIRKGQEPFNTRIKNFIHFNFSTDANRKIAALEIENGDILQDDDEITIDINSEE